ncbi:MAG: hypothetical protein WCQ44_10445, partial [Opitutaceae bacterium]
TFKSQASIKKGLGFGLCHLINYGMHLVLLNFFLLLHCATNFAPVPVFMIAIPINYLMVRFVFKSSKFLL